MPGQTGASPQGGSALPAASDDLGRAMEKALELIGLLSEISDTKAACLTAGDIEGLRSAMEKEEEIIIALDDTEKDRRNKAEALSQAIGLFSQNVSLKELTGAIPDKAREVRLNLLGERLTAGVAALSDKNDRLQELLQMQIGLNDFMLNMLIAPKSRNNAYDIRGSRRDSNSDRGFLDVHI